MENQKVRQVFKNEKDIRLIRNHYLEFFKKLHGENKKKFTKELFLPSDKSCGFEATDEITEYKSGPSNLEPMIFGLFPIFDK